GTWRLVAGRGGLAGWADGARRKLAASIAPGLTGERRAVLAGLVLGEEEGLSEEVRDRFRSSGLYHLRGGAVVLCGARPRRGGRAERRAPRSVPFLRPLSPTRGLGPERRFRRRRCP